MLSSHLRALRFEVWKEMDRKGCIIWDWDRGIELLRFLDQLTEDAACLERAAVPAGMKNPEVREGGNVVLLRPKPRRPQGRGPTPPKNAA